MCKYIEDAGIFATTETSLFLPATDLRCSISWKKWYGRKDLMGCEELCWKLFPQDRNFLI